MDSIVVRVTLLLVVLSVTSRVSSANCLAKPPGGVKFSINSKKNQSGHWNSLVHLRHWDDIEDHKNDERQAWDLDVTQTSEKCGQWETVDVTMSISAPPEGARPGPGYKLASNQGYYKMHTTPKSWSEAWKICDLEGAHLAIVNSAEELKVLQGIFSQHPKVKDGWENDFAHVGFHDLYNEGQYVTIFGDSLEKVGYSKFAQGEPDGGTVANCGCIHRIHELYDVMCSRELAFLCEL